jgi:hypothetical protein
LGLFFSSPCAEEYEKLRIAVAIYYLLDVSSPDLDGRLIRRPAKDACRECQLFLGRVSRKRVWPSEELLLNLRCHRITIVQATESRKGLTLAWRTVFPWTTSESRMTVSGPKQLDGHDPRFCGFTMNQITSPANIGHLVTGSVFCLNL